MSATKQSEREKALEAERDDYKAKYDEAVSLRDEYVQQLQTVGGELRTAVAERDDYKAAHDNALATVPRYYEPYEALGEEDFSAVLEIVLATAHDRGIVTTPGLDEEADAPAASTQPTEVDPHADAKAALVLNKLERCFLMPDGSYCFDEAHARKFMGEEFDTLTVISAE